MILATARERWRAVFGRPVSIIYAECRGGWGRLSALPSIWNGVRALRASVKGRRKGGGGREGRGIAHSWEDEDREALVNEDGRETDARAERKKDKAELGTDR